MATRSPVLSIKVVTDAKDAADGLDQVASRADKFKSGLDKVTPAAAGVVGAIGLLAKSAGSAASDLQQSSGAVESVFKDQAAAVKAAAEQAATNVGLAKNEYQELSTVIGAQLKNMGMPMDAVAGQTGDLIGLGADLAATFGGTTSEAVSALSSLLRGERDPIERYGVSMNQAAIDAKKAAMGLDGLTGEAAKNADLQATLAMLTEQTADAQGQFARETDSAAGASQIANAKWADAKATLGERLLPVMTKASQVLGEVAGWVQQNSGLVTVLVGVLGGLAGAILIANAALTTYQTITGLAGAATKTWAAIQGVFNAVMALNPVVLITLAIIALIAVIVIAYQKSETFREICQAVFSAVANGARAVVDWFASIGRKIGETASSVRDGLAGAWQWALDKFNTVKAGMTAGIEAIISVVKRAIDWVKNLFNFKQPGWMKTIGGWFGGRAAFAAPLGEDAPALRALAEPASAGLVSPARFAPSSTSTPDGAAAASISVVVNGALDPVAVGRQLRTIMSEYSRRAGAGAAASMGMA